MNIILSYLITFLLVLIINVNTEEQKKYGETEEIQATKSNGSNNNNNTTEDNRGSGSDIYYGDKRPGIVINNNDSERIHGGSEKKETQQIQANRTDLSNYIYNKRYGVNKYDGSRRHDRGGINSNDSERRYGVSEEEETEEIQANRTDGSHYINNRRYSSDEYDGSRKHVRGGIYSNDNERRYGSNEKEETEEIQANITDGSNYINNRRYSSDEYDGGRRRDGGGLYSNDSERRYGGSKDEETQDERNHVNNRRYGGDKYNGDRKHDGGRRHRIRHDSRRHGDNKGGKAREILDTIKDVGNKVKDIYTRNFGGDESDGGRRHGSDRRSYGGSRRYRGSRRHGYSQQRGNSQRHSYHPRHGDVDSKNNKLNTFIEYLIPVAQAIAIIGPML